MNRSQKTTDKWVSAILSILMPGVGHMYLGFLGRGLTIIGAFILNIALIVFASMSMFIAIPLGIALVTLFGLVFPVIYFFSIFDALQMAERKHARSGAFPLTDRVSETNWSDPVSAEPDWPEEIHHVPEAHKSNTGSRVAGFALIVIGVVLLIGFLLPNPLVRMLFDNLQALLAVILLAGGGWLIWQQVKGRKGDHHS